MYKFGDKVKVKKGRSTSSFFLDNKVCTILKVTNTYVTLVEEPLINGIIPGGLWLDEVTPFKPLKTILPLP